VFEVKSTSGDTFLGGDDFDQRVMDYLIDEFKKTNDGFDLRKDRQALQRLREAAEKAKIELSSMVQTEINLPYITADANGPKHLVITLTRARLEQLTGDLISKTLEPVRRALSDAGLKAGDIAEAVMVGGMTRMPAVVEAVRREFGKEPHKGVNPDEVVAVGAAIQAGVLGGEVRGVVLVDVTPLTLSVETLGGVATPIVERNTNIPIRKSQVFSTAADGQTQVEIHVLQGERPMASDNKSLGRFILDGIPPARRGIPQVEVTFEINANGILEVSAKDKATSRSQHITITASSGLSKAEIEKMRQEAESHAETDRQHRDLIEARNHADTVAYTAENALKDAGDKIPAETKKQVEEMIQAVRTAMTGEDVDAIRKAAGDLGDLIQKVGGSLYQQPGPEEGDPSAGPEDQGTQDPQNPKGGNPPQDGDVIDGEYRSI